MTTIVARDESTVMRRIRRILLATLWLGTAGTLVELVLLEHYEEWRQIIPLALLAVAMLVLLWTAVDRRAAALRALQGLMILFALAGTAGVLLHFQGNAAFELEMYPDRAGFELFRESMMGATPALAPGTLVQLALVGLAYTYRHPRLAGARDGAA